MLVAALEGHRLWAPVYDFGLNPIVALERRSMLSILRYLRPAKVIDIACGTGDSLFRLQQAGCQVFGCDACEEMLHEARKIRSLRGRLALARSDGIPFANSMADVVLCSLSVGYFDHIDEVFRELARVSRPGGFVAVSDLHPDALASGWTRSFTIGQQRYEIAHHRRSLQEIRARASDAGLETKSYRDVYFGAPERGVFQRSGKEHLFETTRKTPALFISLWQKPC